jgi:hypothetical protein
VVGAAADPEPSYIHYFNRSLLLGSAGSGMKYELEDDDDFG